MEKEAPLRSSLKITKQHNQIKLSYTFLYKIVLLECKKYPSKGHLIVYLEDREKRKVLNLLA